MRTPLVSGLGLLLAVTASAQQPPQLKARELFYTPITETKPTPAKEAPSKAAVVKPPKPKPGPQNTKSEAEHQASHKSQSATSPDGTRLQNATLGDVVGPPLALKYRLLKRSDEGRYDEVDTDTVFRSGDKIRVSVESNDHGYLYIVQQGSSKTWNLLFPNEETEHGSNQVQRNHEYELPSGGRFTFDEQPGEERMFIVLTRRPEPDLEKLIYSLSQGDSAKPASSETSTGKPKLMLAQSHIDNSVIDQAARQGSVARSRVREGE